MALVAGTGAAAHAAGPYPYAGSDDIGRRLTVCATDLQVRDVVGVLRRGDTFTVKGFDGAYKEWVYGFAYGRVNAHGWVQNGWFCNA
ncbi:hypothetical protein BKM31_14930 [[Actinomadura] parvosata subsp. kistnae]|uniref:SH3b domain-containing protein n=1 Tax=[Actinomadura] parvosata subsp. kistnae TaxID=1909395 RepID=A0A1V0AJK0_9ACTN|nr:hypothetical protein BKM31_14930 [Nonomuraea sp. ATCC 55076]